MDQAEMSTLTNNVYHFKEALKKLTDIFLPTQENGQKLNHSTAHERLSEVLRILKKILDMCPDLQTTEILLKTQNVILHVQEYDPDDNEKNRELYDFVSQLATAFSVRYGKPIISRPTVMGKLKVNSSISRISEYLMGGSDSGFAQPFLESSETKCESIPAQKTGGICKLDPPLPSSTLSMTTFGVDLDHHLFQTGNSVPTIVYKCVQEIDKRGLLVKGIYRVSGVKSRVERLCQEFELCGETVDLSDVHPHIIANVLKLYLRQLPQPLFTYQLYPQFVKFSKDWACNANTLSDNTARMELKKIIEKLPRNYYLTATMLIQHLKRVSSQEAVNNMSPSNLGIVFGPTLMRNTIDQSCMFSLLDTVYQTRIVELIITWADKIFSPLQITV